MFGLSGGHLLILLVVVLLLGRNRLPELGSALGKGMNAFKKGLEGEDGHQSAQSKIAQDEHQNSRGPTDPNSMS